MQSKSTYLPVSAATHQVDMRQEMLLESKELAAAASQRDASVLSKLNAVLLQRDNASVLLKTHPLQTKHTLAHQIWQRSVDKAEAALAAEQAAKSVIPAARTAVDVAHKKANDTLEATKTATALTAASATDAAATSTAILNGTHEDPYFCIPGNLWLKHRHQVTSCAKASAQALVILQHRRHVLTHKILVLKSATTAAKIAAEELKAAAHDVTQTGMEPPLRAARQEHRRLENLAKEMQQQRVVSLSKKKSAEDEVMHNKAALETAHATLVTVHEKIRNKAAEKVARRAAKRAAKRAAERAAAAAAEAAAAAAAAQATVCISIAERMKIRRQGQRQSQRQGQRQGQGPAKKTRYH